MSEFINQVMKIDTPEAAKQFYTSMLARIRVTHPGFPDPEAALRRDIGWCFGNGMPLARRQMWRDAVGAVHPVAPEIVNRDLTPVEMMNAGAAFAEQHLYEERHPTAWQLILRERFED